MRSLSESAGPDHFLRTALAASWVGQGRLVHFDWSDAQTTVSPRIPFVTQPTEWCDAQFFDAAALTLDLQQEANQSGFDLKDASAWNVLFRATQPVFCDLLSFRRLTQLKWRAAGQFARHFIVPLWLARRRGLHGMDSFKCWRDGVDARQARALLGTSRFANRCWPLIADASGSEVDPAAAAAHDDPAVARLATHRARLNASLRWMLDGVKPDATAGGRSDWSGYTREREHYPDNSLDTKRELVSRWLDRVRPAWLLDMGCNTGEFSVMALAAGAEVVAMDADHDCIERLYRSHQSQARLYPVVAAIDDLGAGRGWAGQEHPGLAGRLQGRFDMVMMLALLHHLAIGVSVPLVEVAAMARSCTGRWLIVEWIGEDDPQLRLLARQRDRQPPEFSMEHQRQAFLNAGFVLEAESTLAPARRTLALLRTIE